MPFPNVKLDCKMVVLDFQTELSLKIAELLLEAAESRKQDGLGLQGTTALHVEEEFVGLDEWFKRSFI